jgi:hypothetical protein
MSNGRAALRRTCSYASARSAVVPPGWRLVSSTPAAAPAARPVGDRHAAGERTRQLDIHRRRLRRRQLRIQRNRGSQRVMQLRQIAMAYVVVGFEVEPHGVLDHTNQRIGCR